MNMETNDGGSAEEFYADLLSSMHVLSQSSAQHAALGHVIEATFTQLCADILNIEVVAWERIVVVSHTPAVPLFGIGERIWSTMSQLELAGLESSKTAAAFVKRARDQFLSPLDADLTSEILSRELPLDHLKVLAPPNDGELEQYRNRRLEGMDPAAFIGVRRAAATEHIVAAQNQRVRGNTNAAIESVYEADMLTLDAYLIESAIAIGDDALVTVVARWELAKAAIERLAGVPAEFREAVSQIRLALVRSLGAADGERLARSWLQVS